MKRNALQNAGLMALLLISLILNVALITFLFRTHRNSPLPSSAVTLVAPVEGGVTFSNAPLVLRFSSDMAMPHPLNQPHADGPLTFTPAIQGAYTWTSPRRLEFKPQPAWPACSPISATLTAKLKTQSGRPVPGRVFQFQTPPLELLDVYQETFSADGGITLRLQFNDRVSRRTLPSYLRIEGADGSTLPYSVLGDLDSAVLLLRVVRSPQPSMTLHLDKGLPGLSGPLALPAPRSHRIQAWPTLRLAALTPHSDGFGPGRLSVRFNAPLDLEKAAAFIDIEPKLKFSVEESHEDSVQGARLVGEFTPGKAYQVTFRQGLKGLNGVPLTNDTSRTVYFPDRPASLAFAADGQYLSPRGRLVLPVNSVNIRRFKATVSYVFPNNLVYCALRRSWDYGYDGGIEQELGTVVATNDYVVTAAPNQINTTLLNLGDCIKGRPAGAFLVDIQGVDTYAHDRHFVVVTDTGLAVKRSADGLLVWANSIHTLAAVTGAVIRVYARNNQEIGTGTTDAHGLAQIALPRTTPPVEPYLVTAAKDSDLCFLKLDSIYEAADMPGTTRPYLAEGYEAFLYTDRGIYRPGETAHIKAVVRAPGLACPPAFPVQLHILRPDGRRERMLASMLSAFGTAEFAWPTADFALTGIYELQLRTPGSDTPMGSAEIRVEDFVPPQLAVTLDAPPERLGAGERLAFSVKGRHLFGSPAAGNACSAHVRFIPTPFVPELWPGYEFADSEKKFEAMGEDLGTQALDDEGSATFEMAIPGTWRPSAQVSAELSATVLETGGRAVTAYKTCPVDPYPFYLGLKRDTEGALRIRAPERIHVAAVRPDGHAINSNALPVQVTVHRISWVTALKRDAQKRYVYQSERQLQPVKQDALTLTNGTAPYTLALEESGPHLLTIRDLASGASASMELYAGSPDQQWLAWSMEKPGRVELQADKPRYLPGEEAVLVIKAPFTGKALFTLESDQVLEQRVLTMEKNTAEIRVPIKPSYAPNVYASVTLIRPVKAGEMTAAHRAVGSLSLGVTAPGHKLHVTLEAPAQIRPQTNLDVTVTVVTEKGKAIIAEITVAAIDEGICMLTDFPTPDPFAFFVTDPRRLGVALFDLYGKLMPEFDSSLLAGASAPGGDGAPDALKNRLNPLKARRFKPVALWSSTVMTDASGRARVQLPVPEFTGQLRLMAVAISPACFGKAKADTQVKRPLMVQSSLPRFLSPGDTCTMPAILFNETGRDGQAELEWMCQGPILADATSDRQGTDAVPVRNGAQATRSLRFRAQSEPGVAHVALIVKLNGETYCDETEIAVRPAVPHAVCSDVGGVEPASNAAVSLASDWLPGTEAYTLVCSGVPGVSIHGGLNYLMAYPYGCLEQTISASFPLVYLTELMAELQPGSLRREEAAQSVQAGIYRILAMQLHGGQFGYWPNTSDAWEWGSAYATHFLAEAAKAGFELPPDRLDAACTALQALLSRPVPSPGDTRDEHWQNEMALKSYVCLALASAGKPDLGWTSRLYEQRQIISRSACLNVALALLTSQRRREAQDLISSLVQVKGEAPQRRTGNSLNSDLREEALLLSALVDMNPQHPAIPGLMRRLESAARDGHWRTTQETAMAVMALGKCTAKLVPDRKPFKATVSWPGQATPVTITSETHWAISPVELKTGLVAITNEGPGRVYYYWQAAGIPSQGPVPEIDQGLRVRRKFFSAGGAPLDPDWVTQGDLIVVQIQLEADATAVDNIVIEDLLPAGLEPESAALSTSQQIPWVQHKPNLPLRNLMVRDDRIVAFTGPFTGTASFYYAARAVTPGAYAYPPISAECMYDPGIRSVHGARRLNVKGPESR